MWKSGLNIIAMLDLTNVTLIALTDYKFEEHRIAAEKASEGITWGDVKIIYDKGINHDVNNWNRKIVYDLWKYVDTEFAFLYHADCEIINPHLWNDSWFQYDYCGSPFPLPSDDFSYRDINGNIQRVGNSVGLRSKKLLELPTKVGMEWKPFHGYTNEDGFISVNMRHVFEEHGCKFMPFEEAVLFGMDAPLPENEGVDTFLIHQFG